MVLLDVVSWPRLADFWAWPGWTALGVLFGAIAMVAAAVAAVASIRGLSQGRRSQQIANERYGIADESYLRDIEPRPRVARRGGYEPRTYLGVDVVNAGGAALLSLFVVEYQSEVFAGDATLPSHGTAPLRLFYRLTRQGGGTTDPTPLVIAAKDIQGDWWDGMRGVRIRQPTGLVGGSIQEAQHPSAQLRRVA